MWRVLNPLIFFGAAGYVHWFNQNHPEAVLMFPFVDAIFPETSGNFQAMGERSIHLLLGIGGLLLVWSLVAEVRDRARREPAKE